MQPRLFLFGGEVLRRDVLDQSHPLAAFIWFAVMLVLTVVLFHPLALLLSLAGALAYGIRLHGRRAVKYFFVLPLPVAAVMAAVNVLFVHRGVTVLAYLGSSPLTKEALVYGCCAGLMTAAVLMWFYCITLVMTSDKFTDLFGRVMPSASLMLTMTMRFVPHFAGQARRIREARRAMGCGDGDGVRGGLKTISVMTTWALENSIETADSMKARGYGRSGRTSYSIFRRQGRDIALLCATAVCAAAACLGRIKIVCYPLISLSGSTPGLTAFGVLCAMPAALDLWEELRWRYLQSNI